MEKKEKMTKIDEKYKNKKIGEIEKEIKANITLSLEAKKEATFALFYLQCSYRYKENPMYRKSCFEDYLLGFHNIKLQTFEESVRAFSLFETETMKYGIGVVSKVGRDCGRKKQKQVLAEIQEADAKLKNPIQISKMGLIIQKHAKPKKPQNDYKAMYLNEVRLHEITKERYQEALQDLKAAKQQIEALKSTVLGLKPLQEMKDLIKPFVIAEMNQPREERRV